MMCGIIIYIDTLFTNSLLVLWCVCVCFLCRQIHANVNVSTMKATNIYYAISAKRNEKKKQNKMCCASNYVILLLIQNCFKHHLCRKIHQNPYYGLRGIYSSIRIVFFLALFLLFFFCFRMHRVRAFFEISYVR